MRRVRRSRFWLPDAVAGAVVAARCGDGTYFEQIAQLLSIRCVGP